MPGGVSCFFLLLVWVSLLSKFNSDNGSVLMKKSKRYLLQILNPFMRRLVTHRAKLSSGIVMSQYTVVLRGSMFCDCNRMYYSFIINSVLGRKKPRLCKINFYDPWNKEDVNRWTAQSARVMSEMRKRFV